MPLTQAQARTISIIEFRDQDGNVQGGVVGGTLRETFGVTSHPRYGDTEPRRFRYEDVAEVLSSEPRNPVHLATFGRLMRGFQ